MTWTLVEQDTGAGRSPWRILDHAGQPVAWLNDFLDAQALRALSPLTLRMYAIQLLHFGRWWSRHYGDWKLPPSPMLAEYIRAQLQEQPPPETSTINARLGMVHRLCGFHFGEETGWQDVRLRHRYLRRSLLGYGPPQLRWGQLRLKQPRPVITPLTTEQVARFWGSFRTCRDMALVALMLLNGLRSRETLALRLDDVAFSEAQLRVSGKGRRQRRMPLPPETIRLLDLYLRTERPSTASPFLFVSLKGPARGQEMTPAGVRSLFRYHRSTTGVTSANPHRAQRAPPPYLRGGLDPGRCESARPAAVDGACRHSNHHVVCQPHACGYLARVCPRRGRQDGASSTAMKFDTPLSRAFHQQLGLLATTLRPSTMLRYRAVAAHFLGYLKRRFANLRHPDQLRRDPHILGWMEELAQHQPPLSALYRTQQLLCLRRLLEGLADLPHPPHPGLIRPQDLPRSEFHLPRPLSAEDDQLLEQGLRADNDLLANALRLQRGAGLRIGELVDLAADCLHHIGGEHWAIRVPIGKLLSERWVPADQNLREVLARLSYLSTLPPSQPDPQFLLPRPRGRLTLIAHLRSKLKAVARAAGCSISPVPHQLRHTYATDLMRHGVSLPGIMALLGHTTPRMTMQYVQVTQADLQREYLKAQSQPRHLTPPLPVPPSTASAEPASVLEAFRDALRLLDCSRQNLGYPRALDALRRRFIKFIAAAERIYQDKIRSTLAR